MKAKRNNGNKVSNSALDSDTDADPPLAHKAAADGDVPLLVQAIKRDPGVLQQRDREGLTPLAHAVQSQQLHAVKRLVKMGADVDSVDASGRTSLAMAAYQGWNEGVIYLIRKGASQTISDKSGRTPLHASTYDSDPKTLLSLLQRLPYSEINQTDNEKMSAVHWAAFHNRPEHLRELLQRGAEIILQDVDGKTALHWAAQNGCRGCCILLAERDSDSGLLQCTDNSGKTALHLAAAAGHHLILQDLSRFLPDLYEAEDQDDRTPLHWAAAMGHVECLRTLLKLGVSPNPVDIDGGSPLEYAKQAGHKECSELLEERLGLRKVTGDIYGDTHDPSSKPGKSNKGAVGFLKGLFSKKGKQAPEETTTSQSKIHLPALNTNGRSDNVKNTNGALATAKGLMTNASNNASGANDNIGYEPEHYSVIKGVNRLSIDAHMFDDDNQASQKQRKHRRTKKERHKHLREDGSSPTTFKTESSTGDEQQKQHQSQIHKASLRSMHLSPLAGNVHTAALSPRSSNTIQDNTRYNTVQDSISSTRLGELNPLRTGKSLNGIHEIPMPTSLATLRLDQDGSSRSPTPPPVFSLNTRKALPKISPLANDNDNDVESIQNRLRQKYREAAKTNMFLENESDSRFQW